MQEANLLPNSVYREDYIYREIEREREQERVNKREFMSNGTISKIILSNQVIKICLF